MGYSEENSRRLRKIFQEASSEVNLGGILGVTSFKQVYETLMEPQQLRMRELTHPKHESYLGNGRIISIAYAYPEGVIDNIGLLKDGVFDLDKWNIYADWYKYLNTSLDTTSKKIAKELKGVPLTATSSGMAPKITHVSDYWPTVVSHRVHAEQSGIGWRGKNSLIINPRYGCMIRLSGIITDAPLVETHRLDLGCEDCTSCLEACSFLRNRDKLDDYREQCRVYINSLGLNDEVCGKCIKACIHSPRLANLSTSTTEALDQIYYTK